MFEVKSHRKVYTVDICTKAEVINLIQDDIIIIDENVLFNYPKFGSINKLIKIVANEKNKTIDYCLELIKKLFKKYELKKNTKFIAVGGGITQDIVGFISSILYRGVDWVLVPTTLLAQSDSCLGSKTSLNFYYKNLLGTFYPPSKIFICDDFLVTLSKEDLKSGIGEILHFYIVAGDIKSAEKLMKNYDMLLDNPKKLFEYSQKSLDIKKKIIEIDEFDKGKRNIFNYGHTFGHAIETMTDYRISHGRAVTIGMCIANHISYKMKLIEKNYYDRLQSILLMDLPKIENLDFNIYMEALSKDKKNTDDNISCILITSDGPEQFKIKNDYKLKDMISNAIKNL